MTNPVSNLIIVGVGLLGSSIGLATKKRHLAKKVIGLANCRKALDIALQRGAIDAASTEFNIISEIDDGLAIICTPVGTIVELAEQINAANNRVLMSDVGSTKENICYTLEQRGYRFVGAHPIAGSEKSGPEFGNGDLFQNRLTILTPTASSCPIDIEQLRYFWESLGSRVVCLEPRRHDEILAKTSHLPHAVAAILASLLTEAEQPFCGTGFADATRIAAGSPTVWADIFLENRQHLLSVLEEFAGRLRSLNNALQEGDIQSITQFLESAQRNVE